MKKNKYSFLFGLCFFISCTSPKVDSLPTSSYETISFSQLKFKSLSDLLKPENTRYILLRNDGAKELFGRIDKLKVNHDKIYILDTKLRSLTVYDLQGNFIGQIGRRGQGPKEYVNLSDFDVDDKGNVFVLDARLNKLLRYDKNYTCTDEVFLDFQADVLATLANDSLLFGLSSWNTGKGKGYKIAKTDSKGNIAATSLTYDKYVDPGFWISMYMIAHTGNRLSYHQTIDNTIYLLSENGRLDKGIVLDFGNENVPDKDKIDVERKLENYDNYTIIRKILAVSDNSIVGFIWQHRETKFFVINRSSHTCYLSDVIDDIDRRYGCGFSNGNIISYQDFEDEQLPDSVNEFIRNEGFVLTLQNISE